MVTDRQRANKKEKTKIKFSSNLARQLNFSLCFFGNLLKSRPSCLFCFVLFFFTLFLFCYSIIEFNLFSFLCRYNIVFLVLTYGIPMIIMVICYTLMGKELWGSQSIGEHTQRQTESVKSKKKVSVALYTE